jgi:hypothetical protein
VQQSSQPAADIGLPGIFDVDIFKAGIAETDISAIRAQLRAASAKAEAAVTGVIDAISKSRIAIMRMATE